jgi:hypothetical protein
MKKINKILIIFMTLISYIIGIYNLKNGVYVNFLIDILILPTLLLPTLFNKLKIRITEKLEFIYIIFIFFAYFLGTVIDLYSCLVNYDTIMHFLSGIFEAYLGFYILKLLKNYNEDKLTFNILFILGFVSLIAVSWEIFEFTSSIIFKVDPQNVLTTGVTDTMKDLIVALIGAILVCIEYISDKKTINKIF